MQEISMQSQYEAPTIQANRYETGRIVTFKVLESLEQVQTAVYILERPNSIQIKGTAEIERENNLLRFVIPPNALLEPVRVPGVITLYTGEEEDPSSILSTFTFFIDVKEGLLNPEGTYQVGYDIAMQYLAAEVEKCETLYTQLQEVYDLLQDIDAGALTLKVQELESTLTTTTNTAAQALSTAQNGLGVAVAANQGMQENQNSINELNFRVSNIEQGNTDVLAVQTIYELEDLIIEESEDDADV